MLRLRGEHIPEIMLVVNSHVNDSCLFQNKILKCNTFAVPETGLKYFIFFSV